MLATLYAGFTFDYAAAESGIDAGVLAEVAETVAGAGTRFSAHVWRSAAAGNLGGWQVARTLFLISALLGAVATEGGTFPNALNKFVPRPIHTPPHPGTWQDLTWPLEYPLAQNEMSFLLPHFLAEGRGRLDTYVIRAYNPVWTNPDGLSWLEVLTDESKVGCFVALTPTWSESAYLAESKDVMANLPQMWKAFSDLKFTVGDSWAAGDYVAATETFDGTNNGDLPMMHIKKTGKKVSLPFLAVHKLDGGKVKATWIFFQGGGFASQLEPDQAPPAKKDDGAKKGPAIQR